jgi:CheY-like chemotaxis protein
MPGCQASMDWCTNFNPKVRRRVVDLNVVGRQAKRRPASLRRRVLLVDDDLEDLVRYSEVLRCPGYDVRSSTSYREGEAWLEQQTFDLVVVAQGSSNFEGHAVLERAIERNRHAPVLVLTRYVEVPCYLEAMQLGALDYIEKPHLHRRWGNWWNDIFRTVVGRPSLAGASVTSGKRASPETPCRFPRRAIFELASGGAARPTLARPACAGRSSSGTS